jgi:hypothetical protein
MDSNYVLIQRFKMQVSKFSGIISKGLSKPMKKLVTQLIYGIQASQDVKLSNISRSLKEDIPLIKTEDRISRNLASKDFSDKINYEVTRLASNRLTNDMVLAIDPGDIRKPNAKAMEHLCKIYDADKHEEGNGYHLCKVVAASLDHMTVIPMYCEAWSTEAKDSSGVTDQIIKAIDAVSEHIGNRGTWAIDRQGDNNTLIEKFIDDKKQFVSRLKLSRLLFHKDRARKTIEYGAINCPFQATIVKYEEDSKPVTIKLQYAAIDVFLPAITGDLKMVIVKGFGNQPMFLLTNLPLNLHDKNQVWQVVEIYLARWKCDESYRYIKQSYNLEDIRVRGYNAIRNMVSLVLAVAYFATVYLGKSIKLMISVQKILLLSKRFFGVPTFFNYAIADGITELLKKTNKGIGYANKKQTDFQLSFPFN